MTMAPTDAQNAQLFSQKTADWVNRHPHLSAASALIFILHLCFFPFVWGNKTFLCSARDVASILPGGAWAGDKRPVNFIRTVDAGAPGWQNEPWAAVIGYQYLAEKTWPLWNPYQAYGAPLAANMQAQPFNPLFALFSLHPSPWAYNIYLLFRLFLAGFFAYLYLRFFLGFAPSLVGGIASLLAGFYIIYIAMPHLSVEVLLPALFFSIELLLRKPGKQSTLIHALVTLLILFGGMPESALVVLSFGYAYFAFRVLSDPPLRRSILSFASRFAAAVVMGFGLAAVLLLPFAEFMRVSVDTHQKHNTGITRGLTFDGLQHSLSPASYLVPVLLGPPWNDILNGFSGHWGLRGYWGVILFFLSLIAVLAAVGKFGQKPGAHLRGLTAFFGIMAVLILLKRFGSPLVNWFGGLPLFDLMDFAKYDEPLLAFCIAVLAALGADALFTRRLNPRAIRAALLVSLALLGATFAIAYPQIRRPEVTHFLYPYFSIGLAAVLLLLLAVSIFALWSGKANLRRWPLLEACVLLLVTAELSCNYIAPLFYLLDSPASATANPYAGAPMIDFLKSKTQSGQWRVFGRDFLLYPDWAGAFQLSDIRNMDGLYYRRYFPFVNAFYPGGRAPGDSELSDRFTGSSPNAFATPLQRKLLQLSSVKYLLTTEPYLPFAAIGDTIAAANPEHQNLVRLEVFKLNGETKPVLFEHAPYERLPYVFSVGPGKERLLFSVALNPAVYADGRVIGDGVEFRLEIKDSHGAIEQLYDRYIDPKSNPLDRHWFPADIDLKKYSGQTVTLLFSTLPGPKGDNQADWAGWGDLRFDGDTAAATLREVYSNEAKVYEDDDVLPRAAIFHNLQLASSEGEALDRLKDPSVDVMRTAVVEAAGLDTADRAIVGQINQAINPEPAETARIVAYSSQKVAIDATLQRPGLLQLNDSNYPGWKVFVDGKPGKWLASDYLFRGVLLPAGHHAVEYRYAPESFRTGLWVSSGFLLLTLTYLFWPTSRRRDSPAPGPDVVESTT